MKKLLPLLLLVFISLMSCDKDNGDDPKVTEKEIHELLVEGFEQKNIPEYEVISDEILSPEEMADFLFYTDEADMAEIETEGANVREEIAARKREFLEACEKDKYYQLDDEEDPDNAFTLIFHKQKFEYETIDQFNNQITLSAFLAYGEYWRPFKYIPLDQDHIFLVCPYTHTLEDECATESKGGREFQTMVHDNLFIMPDGQGFGSNKDHVQTYLNHNLHARQYYDALVAGENIYRSKGGTYEDDYTLRVLGASQGAGDAIAVHKYLDTQTFTLDLSPYYDIPLTRGIAYAICDKYGVPRGTKYIEIPLRDRFKFEFSYVCCGPYSPESTMRTYSEWGKMSYPCVIPLVIKSMLACCPELAKYKETDFFSAKWIANKSDFDKIYLKKTMQSGDLNKYIRKKLGVSSDNVPLKEILSTQMCDSTSQIYKDLMSCLREQELTSGWEPATRTRVLFSKKDEVVPYVNSEKLFKMNWPRLSNEDTGFQHVLSCAEFLTSKW